MVGGLRAERTVGSSFAEQAVAYGIATADEVAGVSAGWREWADDPAAVFIIPHGEIIAPALTAGGRHRDQGSPPDFW